MDLQSQGESAHTRDANAETSEAVSHQQFLNYRQALERKLQQRTPREHLISQGIMPAAATSTAPALLSQKTKLERAKTGDILQKKIRVRPNRDQLVQRHILNDTSASVDPSLLANQIKLKRKKLEDDLNDRLAVRPGPLELVKENILEQGTPVGLAVQEGNVSFTDTAHSSLLEPISPESNDGSPEPSPDNILSSQFPPTTASDLLNHTNIQAALSKLPKSLDERTLDVPQGLRKERTRKKSPRQKFKKYKYHEYRPPNGEVQKSSLPMDSPYALMLQQQQLYLQLQVLYQNYPQFVSLPSIPENVPKPVNNNSVNEEKPVKIEDMRVVDMRKELKMRGLPVSGSKTDLIERLKAVQQQTAEQNANSPDQPMNETSVGSPSIVTTATSVSCNSPVPVTSGGFVPVNTHIKLGRSNSLPAHEARLQQVQSQLVANSKKLHTQLPPEVQQQLQHLQYLNLQTQLQQLRVQPQSGGQPQSGQLSPRQQTGMKQQGLISSVKSENTVSDSCAFSQQPKLNPLFNSITTSTPQSMFLSHRPDQAPQITMTQAMPTLNYTTSS
ncbi:myocardin-related transcription factor B, partial [Exaiptasia diaphana]|uniref:SAP domain-containing protein n=1 Tax=Exaiptasia diaphana TaxID=2652724 RepID=A0A913Y8K3_EXADI